MTLQLGPVIGTIGGGAGEWAAGSQVGGFGRLDRNEWTPIVPADTATSDGITTTATGFMAPAGDYRVVATYTGGGASTQAMWGRIRVDGTTWDDHEDDATDGATLTATGTLSTDSEIRIELYPRSAVNSQREPNFLTITIIRTA